MNSAMLPFLEYWRSGGPLLIPIALICFGIWAYFFKARRGLRETLRLPEDFEHRLDQGIAESRPDKLLPWLDSMPGTIPQTVAYALRSMAGGKDPVDIFDSRRAFVLSRLAKDIVVLSALAAVAPLLGLLGTVTGMIETFQGVAASSSETTGRVASGIGQALITTQVGLFVAIPGVLGVARLNRITEEVRSAFARARNYLLALKRYEQRPHYHPPSGDGRCAVTPAASPNPSPA